jgi:hypothetical protein
MAIVDPIGFLGLSPIYRHFVQHGNNVEILGEASATVLRKFKADCWNAVLP